MRYPGLVMGALYAATSDAIVITDGKGAIRDANEAFLTMADAAQLRDVIGDGVLADHGSAAQDDEALASTFKWLINGNVHSTTTNVLPATAVSHCDLVSCQLSVSDGSLSAQSNISDVLLPLGSESPSISISNH